MRRDEPRGANGQQPRHRARVRDRHDGDRYGVEAALRLGRLGRPAPVPAALLHRRGAAARHGAAARAPAAVPRRVRAGGGAQLRRVPGRDDVRDARRSLDLRRRLRPLLLGERAAAHRLRDGDRRDALRRERRPRPVLRARAHAARLRHRELGPGGGGVRDGGAALVLRAARPCRRRGARTWGRDEALPGAARGAAHRPTVTRAPSRRRDRARLDGGGGLARGEPAVRGAGARRRG